MTKTEFINLASKHAPAIAKIYKANAEQLVQHLTAIAEVESRFNELAKNKASTARGIMQMLICTQREVEKKRAKVAFAPAMYSCKSYVTSTVDQSKDTLFTNPEYAIKLALYELAYQYKRYGSWDKAVHAYNQGSFPGTRKSDGLAYTKKVMNILDKDISVEFATLTNQSTELTQNFKNLSVSYKEFY